MASPTTGANSISHGEKVPVPVPGLVRGGSRPHALCRFPCHIHHWHKLFDRLTRCRAYSGPFETLVLTVMSADKTYAIHPAIGIARLGNAVADPADSSSYYLGAESPYQVPNQGQPYK